MLHLGHLASFGKIFLEILRDTKKMGCFIAIIHVAFSSFTSILTLVSVDGTWSISIVSSPIYI